MNCCSGINQGVHVACHVVRTTVDVDSECEDPIMSDRSVLVVHMTQRVSRKGKKDTGVDTGAFLVTSFTARAR